MNKEEPFNAQDLEKMVGGAFLLTVPKEDNPFGMNGAIGKIINTEEYSVTFYSLGDLREIECKHSLPMGQYVFNLDNVEFPENEPPVLRGRARLFSVEEALEQKEVVLYFQETPTSKLKMTIRQVGK